MSFEEADVLQKPVVEQFKNPLARELVLLAEDIEAEVVRLGRLEFDDIRGAMTRVRASSERKTKTAGMR